MTHSNLKEGGTYLFSRTNETALTEITVLRITEKAIKVRYANGHESWFTRQKFDSVNTFVEDITPPIPEFSYVVGNPILKNGTFHFTNKADIVNLKEQLEWWLDLLEKNKLPYAPFNP